MMGSTKRREHGLKDPVLRKVMAEMGLDSVPLYDHQSEARISYRRRIDEMAAFRVGPVGPKRREVTDPAAMAEEVKARAAVCGADLVGACALQPVMIDEGVDCSFSNVIAFAHHESYQKVLHGADAVSDEAHRAYFMVAKIATEMVLWIREELGWDAVSHHNGGTPSRRSPSCGNAAGASWARTEA